MKRLCLYALLCLFFNQLKAQDGVVFKIKYLPNHNYQASMNMSLKLSATVSGDQKILDMLSAQGITQPVNADIELGLGGSMKTGSMGGDNTYPLNIDYKISNLTLGVNGKQFPIPPKVTEMDIKVSGSLSRDGKMKIDSSMGKKVTDSMAKKMQPMMDMVQKQIQFPDKPLKPGDTFTQGAPMNIPLGKDNNIKINAGVTYKLVSISDGKAYFEMVPSFSMDFSMQKVAVSISGTGTGKMVYSIKDNFPLSKEGTIDMKMKVTSDKFNLDGTAVITTSYTGTIN
ncbi:MAG: hypothetical protein ABI203_11995 [Mucilaginibacter sp.]